MKKLSCELRIKVVFAGAFMIDPFQMIKVFCKPRIKVGTGKQTEGQTLPSVPNIEICAYQLISNNSSSEWVTKGQTCDQVFTHL